MGAGAEGEEAEDEVEEGAEAGAEAVAVEEVSPSLHPKSNMGR